MTVILPPVGERAEAVDRVTGRPVRVCFVIENLMPAGTELWVNRLVGSMDRTRVQPLLCLLDGCSESSRRLEPANCAVLRLQLPHLKTWRTVLQARKLYRFLREHDVDIVQVHHADPTYLAVPVARWAGIQHVVQTKFDTGYWLKGADLWLHRMCRPFVNLTLANCQACRAASIAQEWSPAEKVRVVENGIPLSELTSLPELVMPRGEAPLAIGLLGNLRQVKNPETLLRAFQSLGPLAANANVHFAGEGDLYPRLLSLARQWGIRDRVRFYGSVADVPAFLGSMHITVLCSASEGLSHALLEYMAAGRATIATCVGGNSEVVRHESNGLLVPAGSAGALAAAIERLIDNPELAERLGRQARADVRRRFAAETMVRRFEALYWDLVHGSTERGGA